MAKPNIALSRFATGPGEAVLVPSSGLRDTGFVAGTPIVEGYVNELFLQAYEWAFYLDAGALEGDFSISGELAVADVITAEAGLVASVNQHVTVSGTGKYKRPDAHRSYPGSAWQKIAGSATLGSGDKWTGIGTYRLPIDVDTWERITQLKFGYNRAGSGALSFSIGQTSLTAGTEALALMGGQASGTGWTTTTFSGAQIDTATGGAIPRNPSQDVALYLEVDCTNGSNIFGGVTITADVA